MDFFKNYIFNFHELILAVLIHVLVISSMYYTWELGPEKFENVKVFSITLVFEFMVLVLYWAYMLQHYFKNKK